MNRSMSKVQLSTSESSFEDIAVSLPRVEVALLREGSCIHFRRQRHSESRTSPQALRCSACFSPHNAFVHDEVDIARRQVDLYLMFECGVVVICFVVIFQEIFYPILEFKCPRYV